MSTEIPITVRGDVDERAVDQLRRCARAGDALAGALCADGHVGYSQPIGGVVAYPDHISPSGVGYDIGCLAAGTRVTTQDGATWPIEDVPVGAAVTCWDGTALRTAAPCGGAVARGRKATLRLVLENGREVVATPDHRIRTRDGWCEAGELDPGDRVACAPWVGLPHEAAASATLDVPPPGADRVDRLVALGLWPVRTDDPRLPALLRLHAALCGDGHLHRDGKAVSWYTVVPEDARSLAGELMALGVRPSVHVRERGPRRRPEHLVRVSSVALHALMASLGCPVGRKVDAWPPRPLRWLFSLPAWLRAQWLAAFAGAEGTTPALRDGGPAPLQIKQAGTTDAFVACVAELFDSLGFRTSVSVSGPVRGDVTTWVIQLLGGAEEQLRFLEEVGFAHAFEKRCAAAAVASVAWARATERDDRATAIAVAGQLQAVGAGTVRAITEAVATEFGVPRSLVHHGLYGRGAPRAVGTDAPDHTGEVAWVPVRSISDGGVRDVFDVVTGDPAAAFQAAGVCVHNCGNKAVRTDVRVEDLTPDLERVMDEVVGRISFGMGRKNDEPVDHPVLDAIQDADFHPQRQLASGARKQLGTVGAGNHYVDLFAGDDGLVWVGVHFGSRGFGHKTASGFLSLAAGGRFEDRSPDGEMDAPPVLLEVDSELGQGYISAMELAGAYAYAGRDVVVDKVLEILGAQATYEVHNHHNYAWREDVGGTPAWVIRKGCTPAFPGQEGFVGATMGEASVILRGTDHPDGEALLHSTVHGAGRVMSRTQAAGRLGNRAECTYRDCVFWVSWAQYRHEKERAGAGDRFTLCPLHPDGRMAKRRGRTKEGRIDFGAVQEDLTTRGIVLRGGAADEAPAAYKRLDEVLTAMGPTIEVLHRLTPIGVVMAPADTVDPYKD